MTPSTPLRRAAPRAFASARAYAIMLRALARDAATPPPYRAAWLRLEREIAEERVHWLFSYYLVG